MAQQRRYARVQADKRPVLNYLLGQVARNDGQALALAGFPMEIR